MSLTTNIYVLRLEGDHYYVGKSEDIEKRYVQHVNGSGSAWTRRWSPISIIKTYSNVSPFEEDKVTKELMARYGIDKVRGGSYTGMELDREQMRSLEREIRGATDLCIRCGKVGHFVQRCPAEEIVEEEEDDDDEEESEDQDDDDDSEEEDEIVEWLCEYCDRGFTTQFGAMVHERSCQERGSSKHASQATSSKSVCFRCGRHGHYSPDCYASRHLNGYDLK